MLRNNPCLTNGVEPLAPCRVLRPPPPKRGEDYRTIASPSQPDCDKRPSSTRAQPILPGLALNQSLYLLEFLLQGYQVVIVAIFQHPTYKLLLPPPYTLPARAGKTAASRPGPLRLRTNRTFCYYLYRMSQPRKEPRILAIIIGLKSMLESRSI